MATKTSQAATENVAKKTAARTRKRAAGNLDAAINHVPRSRGGVSAREFFEAAPRGTMQQAHLETKISYALIQAHVKRGKPIKHVDIARKLAEWSKGKISARKTLGLDD